MTVRVGFLSAAHLHAHGYAHALRLRDDVSIAGVWDNHTDRLQAFAKKWEMPTFSDPQQLLQQCDAVLISSENRLHAEHIDWAATAGKAILCEKPLATTKEEAQRIRTAVEKAGILFMTSLPCRLSPVYQSFKNKVDEGAVGTVLAMWGTNHGTCPFDWFTRSAESGGGALMDHVCHVADLFRDLIGASPTTVYAQTNNLRLGLEVEDTAFLHISFPNGVFATLDASWSRPRHYKTWGDVRISVTGNQGVLEADLFQQALDIFVDEPPTHREVAYGSSLDALLMEAFLSSLLRETEPPISLEDGLSASAVAIAAAESAKSQEPVPVQPL